LEAGFKNRIAKVRRTMKSGNRLVCLRERLESGLWFVPGAKDVGR